MREVRDSISGPVKVDSVVNVSPPLRCFFGDVLPTKCPGAKPRRWVPFLVTHLAIILKQPGLRGNPVVTEVIFKTPKRWRVTGPYPWLSAWATQRWRTVSHTVSDSTLPALEPQTSHTNSNVLTTELISQKIQQ